MNIDLKNGYKFPFDENEGFVCYFGCNSVGKTVISNALDEYFTKQGREVLHFSNDIMEELVDFDEKSRNIQIFPKIVEIKKHDKIVEKYVELYSFKKALRDVGLTNVADKKPFEKTTECDAVDGIVVDETNAIFDEKELSDIFSVEKGKATKSFYKTITNGSFVAQVGTIRDESSIANSESPSIIAQRKQIVDDQLNTCPVCFSEITEEQMDKIKDSINDISLEEDVKDDLLFHLNKETNVRLFKEIIANKDHFSDWLNKFRADLDDSLIAYAYSKVDDKKAISTFRQSIVELDSLKKELSNYEISDKTSVLTETERRIKELIEKHKIFKRNHISFSIKKGRLETKGIDYENMSQSEKNFLKFIYFDILFLSKTREGKSIDLIIDDPFDSYDEANISSLLNVITDAFKNYKGLIRTANIFSHSIRLIYLFGKVRKIINDFHLKWIEKFKGNDELRIYKDIEGFLGTIDYSPSDYWIAKTICDKAIDEYSLICSSIILREHANNCESLFSVDKEKKYSDFYNTVSEKVVHLRDAYYNVKNLLDELKAIFNFKNDVNNGEKKIVDIMNSIDESAIDTISVSYKSGIGLSDSIYKLFIVKYLLSLRIRQIIQKFMQDKHSDLDKNEIGKNIELAVKNKYEDLNSLISFYERNDLVFNEFAHSITKSFSPFFTYCYEDLVSLLIEAKTIVSE